MSYTIIPISQNSIKMQQVEALLLAEGISKDQNLDYTCAILDENQQVIGTGSCFRNTLRCFAIDKNHQGEGLTNQLLTHLVQVQTERGNIHLFLYTKCDTARFFKDSGFYEIARVDGEVVFMENRRTGFSKYLDKLERETSKQMEIVSDPKGTEMEIEYPKGSHSDPIASIVMNANPFSKGHLYLVERAASENALVHLFVVSEDVSLIPFKKRLELVKLGTRHLPNVIIHTTGPYMVSAATFPSYFLKEEDRISRAHANLDIGVFQKIAERLGISKRYVGEEPLSHVTDIYNQVMKEKLPEAGVSCHVVPRLEIDGQVVSASRIRACLKAGDLEEAARLVPYDVELLL